MVWAVGLLALAGLVTGAVWLSATSGSHDTSSGVIPSVPAPVPPANPSARQVPSTTTVETEPSPASAEEDALGGLLLSSPVAGVAPLSGQGAGYHSPDSPFKPLEPRDDVVSWKDLTQVKQVFVRRTVEITFADKVQALHGETVRIQGFMMPLGAGEQQRHFLVASVPLSCPFCTPGGPESIVDVNAEEDVAYSMDAVVVEGRFEVLKNDNKGFYYRLHDARQVK